MGGALDPPNCMVWELAIMGLWAEAQSGVLGPAA